MLPGPILKPPGYASQVQKQGYASQAQKPPDVQVLPLLTEACEEENKHWNAAEENKIKVIIDPIGHRLIYSPGSIHHLKTPVFSGIPYGTYSGSPSVSSDAH